MKIRTQAFAGAAIAITVVLAVSVTLAVLGARERSATSGAGYATRIASDGVSGLRLVTTEYLVYRDPAVRKQWLAHYERLGRMLAEQPAGAHLDPAILANIAERYEFVGRMFRQLSSLPDGGAGPAGDPGAGQVLEARLAMQIVLGTHDMVMDAARLTKRTHAELEAARRQASLVILLVVASTALLMLAAFVATLRTIVAPLNRLAGAAERIGGGDLSVRSGIDRDDEIGGLARAFDRMAVQLGHSRDALAMRSTQLEEANRELEAFSYSVSHDLRAPLRGIDGWSLALQEDYAHLLDDKAREYITIVRRESQRMGKLIDDLLKLSRVGRAEMQAGPVDLSAMATAIGERLRAENPGRRIDFVVQPGLQAHADGSLMEIALTNLLENAAKFTGRLPAARIEFGCAATPADAAGAARREFFVRDNGAGFDMAHARNLFGAFQRLHRESDFPGTGIGLATVKRIIHRHGGQVRAESRPGEGATFHFTLETA